MAAVTQCAFSLVGTSFLVYRLTDNPDRVLYFRHLRDRRTVGMTLWRPEQMEDVTTLMRIESPAALRYFREAMNAATTSACLAMLVTTAEAFAGQTAIVGRCTQCGHEYQYGGTDRATLAAVLGENAYDQLYKKSHGSLRNRLLHGNPIDENIAAMLCGEIYERVLAYLVRTLGLKAIEHIEGAPRRFDSFDWFGAFLRCTATAAPPLRDLEHNWKEVGDWAEQPRNY